MRYFSVLVGLLLSVTVSAQDYFTKAYTPFEQDIPSPEQFLGYGIGEYHTRHDRIVSYLEELAKVSDRAQLVDYGRTHEGRRLVFLVIGRPDRLQKLGEIQESQWKRAQLKSQDDSLPLIINLAYNVHGNEPSSSEAALLTAYTLVASNHTSIQKYREKALIFLDPTINPDGRDRHTQWANSYRATPLVNDPQDAEHNEAWPRGRTNHYWFDLNRDWLLGIHPESRGKLNWYHKWYPHVVTDFHEMGTQSTYFFEPMKDIGSLDPIMPKENYEDLNNLFGEYFASSLDSIGSFYFTREVFDGTYPGYGSSYPDLQGGLGLLFEQASSRGHVQKTKYGEITFPFTIRNQYVSGLTTVKAAVENDQLLKDYQKRFFESALKGWSKTKIRGYYINDEGDRNRFKAFADKLLLHRIKFYKSGNGYVVPTSQPQYRMVQTFFETYSKYRDSVYYDASAWSVANFYHIPYKAETALNLQEEITDLSQLPEAPAPEKANYAYLLDYQDYNANAALYYLQSKGLVLASAFKGFQSETNRGKQNFAAGTLMLPVSRQKADPEKIYQWVREAWEKYKVPVYSLSTGYTPNGIDLGSRHFRTLDQPKAALLIGEGTSSYEAGEVWHLLDTRLHMPISKLRLAQFKRMDLSRYNTLVMISGRYKLDKRDQQKIKDWVSRGNTLITIGTASSWAIDKKLVTESKTKGKKADTTNLKRLPYIDASEIEGKEEVGGVILRADLDLTHPLGFGYSTSSIPVYKNNEVWLKPSKNAYSTVAKYTQKPHIDGYLTKKNMEEFVKPSASLLVSRLGGGRVVLFADNPNFRGSWYGTNRLFMNALFLGQHIQVP
ncbi:M14 family metallopeptidase [Aureicoccus marinus]|uniref:Zinc carboxypeptidase n=1 Tax=Aureicoccus marinus TaxID=754435 RepID=A0A2S7T512_9FLAO|nr:M14 family metallopeptidase [Aureicoccus marinus]PQJ14661.1 zinc carboxypeptidase [Aureicoccus marinus]